MGGEVSTMAQIMMAQAAGGGTGALYTIASPGLVAAGFWVLIIVAFAVLVGVRDHFTDHGDQR